MAFCLGRFISWWLMKSHSCHREQVCEERSRGNTWEDGVDGSLFWCSIENVSVFTFGKLHDPILLCSEDKSAMRHMAAVCYPKSPKIFV